jgi:hypothetical protein
MVSPTPSPVTSRASLEMRPPNPHPTSPATVLVAVPPASPPVPPVEPASAPATLPAEISALAGEPPLSTAPPRKRRRAPASPRKKVSTPAAQDSPLSLLETGTTIDPTSPDVKPSPLHVGEGIAGISIDAVPPKPRRRAVRKKKAPPVVAATPGPTPEVDSPPTDPPSSVPGNEPPPPEAG